MFAAEKLEVVKINRQGSEAPEFHLWKKSKNTKVEGTDTAEILSIAFLPSNVSDLVGHPHDTALTSPTGKGTHTSLGNSTRLDLRQL